VNKRANANISVIKMFFQEDGIIDYINAVGYKGTYDNNGPASAGPFYAYPLKVIYLSRIAHAGNSAHSWRLYSFSDIVCKFVFLPQRVYLLRTLPNQLT
jgi:hypothetical protein